MSLYCIMDMQNVGSLVVLSIKLLAIFMLGMSVSYMYIICNGIAVSLVQISFPFVNLTLGGLLLSDLSLYTQDHLHLFTFYLLL